MLVCIYYMRACWSLYIEVIQSSLVLYTCVTKKKYIPLPNFNSDDVVMSHRNSKFSLTLFVKGGVLHQQRVIWANIGCWHFFNLFSTFFFQPKLVITWKRYGWLCKHNVQITFPIHIIWTCQLILIQDSWEMTKQRHYSSEILIEHILGISSSIIYNM
jgi:hypothetical protein